MGLFIVRLLEAVLVGWQSTTVSRRKDQSGQTLG